MQVVIFIILIVAALVVSALIYTSQDRRMIRRNFVSLMKQVPGTLKASNPFAYPEAEILHRGKKVTVAFHIHEVNRTSFLNMVYRIPVRWDGTFLMLKKDFFKPIRSEEKLTREVGGIIPELEENYVVRAKDGEKIRSLLKNEEVHGSLKDLEEFPNILVDSRMLMVSKPYDGTKDTTPERIMENVTRIGQLAASMEVERIKQHA